MPLSRIFCCFGNSNAQQDSPRVVVEENQKPPADSPSTASCSTPGGAYNFVFDDGNADRVTGVNISGSNCAVDRPVQLRTTPYEERIEKMLQAEESAREKQRLRQQAQG